MCEYREMSTDEHLQLLLCQLNSQCFYTTTKIATEIIIQVGKQLLNNHALLLSKVYTDFSARLHKEGVESVPSKRWLLAEIVIKLSPHVELCCKIQKLGTMLYRSGGDILYALSYALGQASKDTSTIPPTAHLLNKHVHSTAAEFISCYRDSLASYPGSFPLTGAREERAW